VQKGTIFAYAFKFFFTASIKQLPLHSIEYLVAFKASAEKSLQLSRLLDMVIDDKKFPIADSGWHVKTAGSTSRPTVNSPTFLLHFADGVDQILVVQPEGPLAQTFGVFWQTEMLAKSFHLTHGPNFTKNACHFCHERSALVVVQLRDYKSSIGLLPRDGESSHA
jgi:hypothetical protein